MKKNKNTIQISSQTKKDIEALCQDIFEFESEDYEQMKDEGADVKDHPYAIASRIWDKINDEDI